MIRRCVKNYCKNIDKVDMAKLYAYGKKYNNCKNLFYNKFYYRIDLIYLPYKFELRDRLLKQIKTNSLPENEISLLTKVPAKL